MTFLLVESGRGPFDTLFARKPAVVVAVNRHPVAVILAA